MGFNLAAGDADMSDRELLDDDGENLALRTFLAFYGNNPTVSIGAMKDCMETSGWGNHPEFASRMSDWSMTKGTAQMWIRHLLSLEQALARPEQGCAECGVKASDGYALYCVACTDLFTQPEQEPVANEVRLNIIRWWPDGFANQLEHVWKDLIGFIPNYKLLDLQRLLAEFGFTMKIYEGEAPTISEPVKERISETVAFEDWVKGQHAMPGDIGFRQALKTAYEAGAKIHGVLISEPVENLEPVAYMHTCGSDIQINTLPAHCYGNNWTRTPLYTAPPSKPWVSMTFEEIKNIWVANYHDTDATDAFAYAIEAALRSKNNG